METMKVGGGPYSCKLPEVTVPKHGIKLYKLTPASGNSGSAQKRSKDGLDKATRDFAEIRPSRIMARSLRHLDCSNKLSVYKNTISQVARSSNVCAQAFEKVKMRSRRLQPQDM